MTRYVVGEVSGSRYPGIGGSSDIGRVTASVHDRLNCYRDVALFRAEDGIAGRFAGVFGKSPRLGNDRARQLARELADRLNAEWEASL